MYKDLTGQKFGRLVVVEVTDERNKHGSVIWKCLCDCGNEHKATTNNLKGGTVRSCGCLRLESLNNIREPWTSWSKKRPRIKLKCERCNNSYEVRQSQAKRSKFCSFKCRNPNFPYNTKEWKGYLNTVRKRSYRTYKKFKEEINPLDFKLGKKSYHLDHKYSIHDGFRNSVPVSAMSCKENLQILPYKENLRKNNRSSITLSEVKQWQ